MAHFLDYCLRAFLLALILGVVQTEFGWGGSYSAYFPDIQAFSQTFSGASGSFAQTDDSPISDGGETSLIFDSGLIIGVGVWTAPALPRLIIDENYERLDIENYLYSVPGQFVSFETRLYLPISFDLFPLGLSIMTTNWVTESPALSFTLTPKSGSVRPSHFLGLGMGLRSDFSVLKMRTESSIELSAQRMFYLAANLTSVAPVFRFRLASDKLLSSFTVFSQVPTFAIEVFGSPSMHVVGNDNRLATDASGVVRNFADFVELSPQSSGLCYGAQVDLGFSWSGLERGREHSFFATWSFSTIRFTDLLTRTTEEVVSQVDVNSAQQSLSVSLRSSFQ